MLAKTNALRLSATKSCFNCRYYANVVAPRPARDVPCLPQIINCRQSAVTGADIFTAIEIGSHCTRAFLHDGVNEIARVSYDTLLSKGLTQGRMLLPESIQNTLSSLCDIKSILQQQRQHQDGIIAMRVVGTAAVRSCSNPKDLTAPAERLLGCQVQVLTECEEGALAFLGATAGGTAVASGQHAPSADGSCSHLVMDLGGRSTEFIYGTPGQPADELLITSIPLGCVALAEAMTSRTSHAMQTHAGHVNQFSPPASTGPQQTQDTQSTQHAPDSSAADDFVRQCMQHAQAILVQHLEHSTVISQLHTMHSTALGGSLAPCSVLLTGGTVTTAAAVLKDLPAYEHNQVHMSVITRSQLLQMAADFTDSGFRQNAVARLPWLTQERALTMAAGCSAAAAVLSFLGLESAHVSDADLLDGLMLTLLPRKQLHGG